MMRSKKDRLILGLVVLVVVLLGADVFLIVRSGVGVELSSRLARGVQELEGFQWLLSQMEIGWVTPQEAAGQWLEHGQMLEQEGRYREALQAYEKALNLVPDEAITHMAVASAYEALGKQDQALAHMEEAVQLDPENAAAQRHLGRLNCLRDEHEACVAALEKAVEIEPDDKWGRFWLANAYLQNAEDGLDRALAQYEEALRLEPEFGEAHFGLGQLYYNQPGNEVLAIEEFKQALDAALEANDEELATRARAGLASVFYAQDNYSECIDQWTQVVVTNPGDVVAHRRLALCYALRGREGDLEQAIAKFEHALTLDQNYVDIYFFYLGQYYASQEDYPRAIWAWEQFLRFSNDEEINAELRNWIEQHTR
jgi:tetratricopeptide (TPR) repeat protein